jgi:rubredoxin
LVNQLIGLERRVARSGKDSIDHGPGMHDDLCNSAAGALVEALGGEGELGLIEWFKGVSAGIYPAEQQPAPSSDPFSKQATLAFEMKLMGVKPAGLSEEVISPCRCGGTRVFINGAGYRCQQCGSVYRRQDEADPISVPTSGSACCGNPLMQRIGAATRCANCGWQSDVRQPTGVSRDTALSGRWTGGRAKMNSGAFRQAFARLLGRGGGR